MDCCSAVRRRIPSCLTGAILLEGILPGSGDLLVDFGADVSLGALALLFEVFPGAV